ncbi:MAG: hypothetical protein R3C39_03835 [Dehalococcoidia bacterium]
MLVMQTFERRDHADRNEMALAALQLCRVQRARSNVSSAKFYWPSWDSIAVLVECSSFEMDEQPNPDLAKAGSGLANLARMTDFKIMAEAGVGQEAYEVAGRPSGT